MNGIRVDHSQMTTSRLNGQSAGVERFVNAPEFHALMVSHRRMVRENKTELHARGLRDLDTGELFLIDERRLYDAKR